MRIDVLVNVGILWFSVLLSDYWYAIKPLHSAEIKCILTATVNGKTLYLSSEIVKCFQCEWF